MDTVRLGRMETHVRVASILFVIFGVLTAIGILLAMSVASTGLPSSIGAAEGTLLLVVLAGVLLLACLELGAGIGLLQGKPWGRTLGFIAAALTLFSFPFGTAFSIYVFWVLTRVEVADAFAA